MPRLHRSKKRLSQICKCGDLLFLSPQESLLSSVLWPSGVKKKNKQKLGGISLENSDTPIQPQIMLPIIPREKIPYFPMKHDFGPWEEVGVPGENPRVHEWYMQTWAKNSTEYYLRSRNILDLRLAIHIVLYLETHWSKLCFLVFLTRSCIFLMIKDNY